jgi:hypothetical protein
LPFKGSAPDIGAFETGGTVSTADVTAPVVTAFTVQATATSLTVPLASFTATDNIGVTGYLVNETATTPSLSSSKWSSTAPTTYQALTTGPKTLYAWSKDAAGNVSTPQINDVTITDGGIATGTGNIVEPLKIDVFPNPCRDQVTVRFSETPEPGSHIEIFDVTGRNVASREITNSEEQFSLGAQSAGLYMVKTKVGTIEKVTKLIINK